MLTENQLNSFKRAAPLLTEEYRKLKAAFEKQHTAAMIAVVGIKEAREGCEKLRAEIEARDEALRLAAKDVERLEASTAMLRTAVEAWRATRPGTSSHVLLRVERDVRAAVAATETDIAKWLAEHDKKVRSRLLQQWAASAMGVEAMAEYDARVRAVALEEAAAFVEMQKGGFTRNEVDLLHAIARELRALVTPAPAAKCARCGDLNCAGDCVQENP